MAKTSGSNGGLPNGDSNYKGKVGKLEPLASIKNPKVYKTVKESISRFHSVLGVRQKDIKIGQLEAVDDYIDNYNGDMIAWFWAKYQEQEQKEQ